jgi:hypothetical protein
MLRPSSFKFWSRSGVGDIATLDKFLCVTTLYMVIPAETAPTLPSAQECLYFPCLR